MGGVREIEDSAYLKGATPGGGVGGGGVGLGLIPAFTVIDPGGVAITAA